MHNQITITRTQNGYIVAESHQEGHFSCIDSSHVFQTMGALQRWLAKNYAIDRPRTAESRQVARKTL